MLTGGMTLHVIAVKRALALARHFCTEHPGGSVSKLPCVAFDLRKTKAEKTALDTERLFSCVQNGLQYPHLRSLISESFCAILLTVERGVEWRQYHHGVDSLPTPCSPFVLSRDPRSEFGSVKPCCNEDSRTTETWDAQVYCLLSLLKACTPTSLRVAAGAGARARE